MEGNVGALAALGNGSEIVAVQQNGAYQFDNLAPGNYTIMLYAPGYAADTLEQLEVVEGKTLTADPINLEIELNTGSLFGEIVLEDGSNPAGTSVLLVETGQATVVNSQGISFFGFDDNPSKLI